MSRSVAFTIGLCLLPGFVAVDRAQEKLDTFDFANWKGMGNTNAVGLQFLEENMIRPGVVTLDSGLQYKVLLNGTGDHLPRVHSVANTSVELQWTGTTPTLTPHAFAKDESAWNAYESTRKGPVTYSTGGPNEYSKNLLLKGMAEAVALMVEGDRWELYMPAGLGYGDITTSKLNPGDVLIVRLQLLKITGQMLPRKVDEITGELCDWKTLEGCNEQDTSFIAKQNGKTPDARLKELERLTGLWHGGISEGDKKRWILRRHSILNFMVAYDDIAAEQIAILKELTHAAREKAFLAKMQGMTEIQKQRELAKFERMLLVLEEGDKKDWLNYRTDWLKRDLAGSGPHPIPPRGGKSEL